MAVKKIRKKLAIYFNNLLPPLTFSLEIQKGTLIEFIILLISCQFSKTKMPNCWLIFKIVAFGRNLDLYRMCGDGGREAEAYQMHANFSQHLMIDDSTSHQCSEHALISWVEQPLASFLQLNSNMVAASTSNMMVMPAPGSSIMWKIRKKRKRKEKKNEKKKKKKEMDE